jgi:hypothetical protein
VGLGEAEVGEHAVAHQLSDHALIAGDGPGNRALVGAEQVAHVLRIESDGERGRVH